MIQDIIVTTVACGAAAVILLKVTGIGRHKKQGACDSCGSSQQACAPAKPAAANTHPLRVHLARKH